MLKMTYLNMWVLDIVLRTSHVALAIDSFLACKGEPIGSPSAHIYLYLPPARPFARPADRPTARPTDRPTD